MKTRTVFFVGKPGCGKGMQAKLLSEKTGWKVFASGKLFREIAQENTPVGHKVKKENDIGMLQPHWFAMYLYLKSLFSVSDDEGVIFDGFNRKIQEAELIVSSLEWLGRPFTVILLSISDEEVKKRLANRRHTDGRADDHFVEERLAEYNTYTLPALEIFRKSNVLVEIDGSQTPEEVAAQTRAVLHIK